MIYSSVNFFIFSLVGCLANSSFDVKSLEKHVSETKQKFQEDNQMPVTFSGKLEKFTSLKFHPLEKSKLEDMVFDEPQENHLRGLRIKDNFLTFTSYKDNSCNEFESSFGELVNYCHNIAYPNKYSKGSYAIKVNKKEKTIIQLEYETEHCIGLPSKITSLTYPFPSFTNFGRCSQQLLTVDDDRTQETKLTNYVIDYISSYPEIPPGQIVTRTYPESYCSDKPTQYSSYYTRPITDQFYNVNVCQSFYYGYSSMYSTASCSVDGQFYYYNYYSSSTCSGTPSYSYGYLDTTCHVPYHYDIDDDDDAYFEIGVLETTTCT